MMSEKEYRIETPVGVLIVGAEVILTRGRDAISLKTKLPGPVAGLCESSRLWLEFKATKDTGIEYCRTVLRIDPKVINVR